MGEAVANRWAWRAHGLFCASPCKDDYRICIPSAYSPAENTCQLKLCTGSRHHLSLNFSYQFPHFCLPLQSANARVSRHSGLIMHYADVTTY